MKSNKNIKKNKKYSKKNIRKNKCSRKNVRENNKHYSRKNVMRGGNPELINYILKLTNNDRTLTTLNISGKNINALDAEALATALATNTTLKTFDISNNKIGDVGAIALARALKVNTTLTELNISANNIGNEGAKALAEALLTNNTLQILNISINDGIGEAGAYALIQALSINPTVELISDNIVFNGVRTKPFVNKTIDNTEIDNANTFIDTIIKQENIKNKSLNINGKTELTEKSKSLIAKTTKMPFKSLIANNYTKGKKSLETIDHSDKYLINLHGSISKDIFKLPDNINIIFLSPIGYLSCSRMSYITLESIQKYFINPFCDDNNPIFKEATLYLGGQYCIDLNLSREVDDSVQGIMYVNEDEKKIENAYKYNSGNYFSTLSKFLYTEQDHTNTYFNQSSKQYTFIVNSCREKRRSEKQKISHLVFYELSIKKLNFYLYFMNDEKKQKMSSSNNGNDVVIKYVTCKKKKNKDIENKKYFSQRQDPQKETRIYSIRNNYNINNNTTLNKIKVGELKKILKYLNDSNKEDTFEVLFKNLNLQPNLTLSQLANKSRKLNNRIYLDNKYKFDIIKYIFKDNYNLMFEFLAYIDIITGIIYYDYFFKDDNDKRQLDVSKINYRITLSALKFIVSILTKNQNTTLDISKSVIGINEVAVLATMLQTNKTLTTLNISNNEIGAVEAEALAKALSTNTTLTTLDISNNQIGDEGAKALATALKGNISLTTLVISNNEISDAGAKDLAEVLNTTKLENLDIKSNYISDAGATDLATALALNKKLKSLNISNNTIDNEGAQALDRALDTNDVLTTLDISNNNNIDQKIYDSIETKLLGPKNTYYNI